MYASIRGGQAKFIAPGAVLGFHSPAFPGMSKADLTDAVAEQTRLFTMAGFSYSFVTRALNTPNTDLWKPTVAELLAAKAITGVSDGTQFAVSGFGVITKTSMAERARASPSCACSGCEGSPSAELQRDRRRLLF